MYNIYITFFIMYGMLSFEGCTAHSRTAMRCRGASVHWLRYDVYILVHIVTYSFSFKYAYLCIGVYMYVQLLSSRRVAPPPLHSLQQDARVKRGSTFSSITVWCIYTYTYCDIFVLIQVCISVYRCIYVCTTAQLKTSGATSAAQLTAGRPCEKGEQVFIDYGMATNIYRTIDMYMCVCICICVYMYV